MKSAVALLLIALVAVTGCHKESAEPKSKGPQLDKALAKISPEAALIDLQSRLGETTNCLLAEVVGAADQPKGELAGKVIGRLQEEAEIKCKLFQVASIGSAPVFERMKETGQLPDEAFVFFIYEKSDDSGFHETAIGPFETAEICSTVAKFALDNRIGVRSCQRWGE